MSEGQQTSYRLIRRDITRVEARASAVQPLTAQKAGGAATQIREAGPGFSRSVPVKLQRKGVPFAREVRIFDICNPHREALEKNPLVAAALPCAIAVYSEGDNSAVVFVRPTVMLGLFGDTEMKAIAEDVERSVRAIVEAATQSSRT